MEKREKEKKKEKANAKAREDDIWALHVAMKPKAKVDIYIYIWMRRGRRMITASRPSRHSSEVPKRDIQRVEQALSSPANGAVKINCCLVTIAFTLI